MDELLGMAKDFITENVLHMKKPEADLTDVQVKQFDRSGLQLESNVAIHNPYSHDLPIFELTYQIKSGGREIISGRIADPGSIRANDRTNVKLPVSIPSDFLMSIIRDISADWDIDYELNANLIIDIPIIGNFNLPLSKKGTIKLPTLSDIF